MLLVTRMAALQAEQRRESQWHPRVQNPVPKRAPYHRPFTPVQLFKRAAPLLFAFNVVMQFKHRQKVERGVTRLAWDSITILTQELASLEFAFKAVTQCTVSNGKRGVGLKNHPCTRTKLAS
jgi:hypothetical protein